MRGRVVDVLSEASGLVELIASGKARRGFIVSGEIGIEQATEYYEHFYRHLETKVMIWFAKD